MIRNEFDNGWEYLNSKAESRYRDDRQTSLIRSYSWVEIALAANNIVKNESLTSIAKMILYAQEKGFISNGITKNDVYYAIQRRNEAAHEDTVPEVKESKIAVKVFNGIWNSLRTNAINKDNAIRIADGFSKIDGIFSIHLYGSLARNSKNPNDIDLLILDDGRFSSKMALDTNEYTSRKIKSTAILNLIKNSRDIFLNSFVQCRWLDLSLFDANKFGYNIEYTKSVVNSQNDRNFFLNISNDVLEYDEVKKEYVSTTNMYFKKLKIIKNILFTLGIE